MNGIFRNELECNLSDKELATYSGELARLTQEQSELEDRKKEVNAGYKARIDACISQMRVIARKVSTRKEMRDVDVRWNFDFMANVKVLERLDTLEIIDTRALTDNERQMCLELEEAANSEESEELPSDSDDDCLPEMEESEASEQYPETDSFEYQDCRKKKKARKCGADCGQA